MHRKIFSANTLRSRVVKTYSKTIIRILGDICHTRFLSQNRVLIVCMTQDHLFHTYSQKCSQITKCHNIEYNYYTNNVFTD
jgi:hypothetical protein